MATGLLSWSKTAASNATADSAVNFAEGQAPSSVNDSARALMASAAKYRDDISGMITLGGGTTAYTFTSNQSIALTDGAQIAFTVNATNTGASTLNVDSTGAVALQKIKGTDLVAGELVAGCVYTAAYDAASTAAWVIHGGRSQPYDAELVAIAGLTSAADKAPYFTGSGTAALHDFTSVGRTLVAQATQALMRTTGLGLGTSAVIDTGTSGTKVPLLDGNNTWSGTATFSNSAGVTAKNTAKAWATITWSAGTPSIQDSFGIASVTDNGTGDITITFTNAFSNANYAWSYSVVSGVVVIINATSQLAGSVRINSLRRSDGNAEDPTRLNVVFFSA